MSSGVQFDEDTLSYGRPMPGGIPGSSSGGTPYGRPSQGSGEPRMVRWLMDKGIVKSPRAAQGFLVGFIVINLIISYVLITYFI